MPVFGLTGNLASGKSTILRLLKNKGAVVFDADDKIHRYYRNRGGSIYKKIASVFPRALQKGVISRRKLADIVFSNKNMLRRLEGIIHPVIIRDLKDWAEEKKYKKRIYIAEVPLLFEKNLVSYFTKIILVIARKEVVVKRIMKKHNLSKGKTLNRLSLYIPLKEKVRMADFVIDNSLSFKKLEKEVDLLWRNLKQS